MKISKTFVKIFLSILMFVILVNIITPFFGVWNVFYLIALGVLCLFLLFLVFRKKEDGLFKVVKIMVLIIPVLLIGYIVYSNFIASHEFSYFYDIGSEKDAKKPYLTPVERTSEADINNSLRNITSNVIYFEIPLAKNSNNLSINIHVKDTFPKKGKMSLGIYNATNKKYFYTSIYNSTLFNNTKGEWINLSTNVNLKDLNSQETKLKLVLNIPHLAKNQNETNKMYVAIDWIDIRVYKDGIFKN